MERLWAPWRTEYITQSVKKKPDSCVFCDIQAPGDDRARLVVHRGEHSLVVLNRYPYNNGHLLVMPNAHIGRFEALDEAAFLDLHTLVVRSIQVLEAAMQPQGINLGMNLGTVAGAGIPDHMHYHLVPRWGGDTNFMPVVGETKVISQHVLDTYDRLKPHFDA